MGRGLKWDLGNLLLLAVPLPNCKLGFKQALPLVLQYLDYFGFELIRAVLCSLFLEYFGQWHGVYSLLSAVTV